MNRLADSSSPYLRQHQDNPVAWQPWDDQALQAAKSMDRPIFLSIGYSSCHWCHVMEHESFENREIAQMLNDNFVSIKVDREERPDVDEAFMAAVQMSTGHGGWPMTLFLTPDAKPFFAGTYFPPEDRGPYAGFKKIIEQVAAAWKGNREELEAAAEEFASALKQALDIEAPEPSGTISDSLIDSTVSQLKRRFDYENGGFEGKPKFPPHQAIALLLYLAQRRNRKDCLELATRTLDKMLIGGIHDQVGGGFHRYSTDEKWLLPHFEKMLYDNGLLLRNFAAAYELTENPEYARVCKRLAAWLSREMLSPEGTFYSALDADSEGEEGRFYTWPFAEVAAVASQDFLRAFQVREAGNFRDEASGIETNRNILHLSEPPGSRWDAELDLLLREREKRVKPGLDDKVLVSWNGLAISGLARAGEAASAGRAAHAILRHRPLPHQIVNGKAQGEAFLDDYAFFIQALLDLADTQNDLLLRREAERLFKEAESNYKDPRGGWFFTSGRQEVLFGRSKQVFDSATPSPNGIMVCNAIRLGKTNIAEQDLRSLLGWMERAPLATEALLLGAAMYLDSNPSQPEVRVFLEPKEARVEDGRITFVLRMQFPQGYHLEQRPALETAGLQNLDLRYSQTEIIATGEPPSGKEGEAKLKLTYQICSESACLPEESKELSIAWYRE